MADPATNFKLQQFRQAYPSLVHYTCEEIRSFYPEIPKEVWDEFERNALKAPAIVKGDENATIQEYKVSVENWLVAESNKFIQRNENELGYYVEVDDDSGKPAYIPYSYIVKYLAEIIGIGDADDFADRIAKINRFIDNAELNHNAQIIGNIAKAKAVENGNKQWILKGLTNEESIKFWEDTAQQFRDILASLELNELSEKELIEAMTKKGFISSVNKEKSKLLMQDYNNAITNFSKKGQSIPFNEFDKGKVRKSVEKATKKFNKTKNVLDILSNAKLNAILGLLFTPTPLYEKSYVEVQRENGYYKLFDD